MKQASGDTLLKRYLHRDQTRQAIAECNDRLMDALTVFNVRILFL